MKTTWKLTKWGQTREGLAGVPWRDLTEDEHAAALRLYPELDDRGYFEQIVEPLNELVESQDGPGLATDVSGCSCRWKNSPYKAPEQHANYCAVRIAAEEGD